MNQPEGPSRPDVPWGVRDVLKAVGLAVLIAAAGTTAVILWFEIVGPAGSPSEQRDIGPWTVGLLLQGSLVVSVWVFAKSRYRATWGSLGLTIQNAPAGLSLASLALLGSLTANVVYGVIASALGAGALEVDQIPRDVLGRGMELALNLVVVGLWVPFAEELFFRGFMLPALAGQMGTRWAAVISSSLFAVGHLTPFSAGAVVPALVAGLLFSWLYFRTGSILPSILAHSAQNSLAITVLVLYS